MAMPRKLKLMNVFLNGYSYQGVAKSVTLPKLTRKLENYRGAGMNGSAPVDLGLDDDALSMEWSLGGFPDSVIWELYAATGEGKQGEDTESKISVVCTYFRLTMDGKELVEIDTINMIEKVNGVDRLEQHRRNIGL
ncbi:TPA: phage major tail tube protein [Escherichia coli]|nr:phage tail protein [Escherichia coli]